MPISAFSPKSGHTSCYTKKQITINFLGISLLFRYPPLGTQIATPLGISQPFCCPSIGTQIVTHLGISPPFCYPSIGTQIVTSLGISQDFRPQLLWTLFVTSNLSAIVFVNELQGHYPLFATLLQPPKQKNQLRSEITLKPEPVVHYYLFMSLPSLQLGTILA